MRLFRRASCALVLLLAVALAACGASAKKTAALIEAPAVGDLYAAQLSAFSEHVFRDMEAQPIDPAYGLLKVIAADAEGVVVVTENAASPSRDRARADLDSNMAGIAFETSERIRISRAHLRQAHADGLIYAAHRPQPAPGS